VEGPGEEQGPEVVGHLQGDEEEEQEPGREHLAVDGGPPGVQPGEVSTSGVQAADAVERGDEEDGEVQEREELDAPRRDGKEPRDGREGDEDEARAGGEEEDDAEGLPERKPRAEDGVEDVERGRAEESGTLSAA
jgi:hypothetical protein